MYQVNSNFVLRTVAGENLLIPLAETGVPSGTLLMLNETGSFIWKLLEIPREFSDIVKALKKEFDASDNIIELEAKEFIQILLQKNLIIERGY